MTGAELRHAASFDRLAEALGAEMAARVDVKMERMLLASISSDDVPLPEPPLSAILELPMPAIVIGFVCRPDFAQRVRAIVRHACASKRDPAVQLFAGIPVFEKEGQRADCFAFYDRGQLDDYLAGKIIISFNLGMFWAFHLCKPKRK